jgi:hypothetical protein
MEWIICQLAFTKPGFALSGFTKSDSNLLFEYLRASSQFDNNYHRKK